MSKHSHPWANGDHSQSNHHKSHVLISVSRSEDDMQIKLFPFTMWVLWLQLSGQAQEQAPLPRGSPHWPCLLTRNYSHMSSQLNPNLGIRCKDTYTVWMPGHTDGPCHLSSHALQFSSAMNAVISTRYSQQTFIKLLEKIKTVCN